MNRANETMARGSALLFLGVAIRVALLFATEVILARHLGADGYGLLSWAFMAISLVSIVTVLGMNTAAQRFIPYFNTQQEFGKLKNTVHVMVRVTLVGGLAGAVTVMLLANRLGGDLFGDAREPPILVVLAMAVPFWNLQKICLGIAAGFKKASLKLAIEDVLLSVSLLAVAVTSVLLGLRPLGVTIGYVAAYLINGVSAALLIRRLPELRSLRAVAAQPSAMALMTFSWPLIFVGVLGKLTGMTDVLILGSLMPSTEVGLYRVASDLAVTMSVILMALGFLYLPLASEMHADGDRAGWQAFNKRIARWAMLLVFPVFAVLFFRSAPVIEFLYGREYLASAPVLRLLALAYFLHVAVGFTGTNLTVVGRTASQLAVHVVAFGVNVGGNLLLVPVLGMKGAAFATLASLVLVNALSLVLTTSWLRIHPFSRRYCAVAALLVVGAGVVDWVLQRVVSGMLGTMLFLACVLLYWGCLILVGISADRSDRSILRTMLGARVVTPGVSS